MKAIKIILYIICSTLFLTSCLRPELAQHADGSWYETGDMVAYPQIDVVRGAKNIHIPKILQDKVLEYHQINKFWPFSLAGLLGGEETNALIKELESKGYQDIWFSHDQDTFYIHFNFKKLYAIRHNQLDDDPPNANLIPGLWKFHADSSQYWYDQELLNESKKFIQIKHSTKRD